MKNIFWKLNKYQIIILLVASLVPKILIAVFSIPLVDIVDETAALSVASYLSGFDWTNAISKSGYYGFGYYSIFYLLLKSNFNIVTIYKIINIVTVLFTGLIPLISYYILEKYVCNENKWEKILISLWCSYITVVPVDRILNDHMLCVVVWVITLVLCKLLEHKNKIIRFRVYSCLLALLLGYGMILHTRAITIVIAVFVLIGTNYIIYKEHFVSKLFYLILLISFSFSEFLIMIAQSAVWGVNDKNELINATVKIPDNINWLMWDTWIAFFKILVGIIGSFSIFTLGIGLVLTIYLIYFIYQEIVLSRKINNKKENLFRKCIFNIVVTFGACCGATILAQAITWLPNVLIGIESKEIVYGFKVFTYLRYFCVYAGPVLLCGASLFLKKITNKITIFAFVITIAVILIWLTEIIPFISGLNAGTSPFFSFAWTTGQNNITTYKNDMYYMSVHIMIWSLILYVICKYKKCMLSLFVFFNILFIYRYCYFSINFSFPVAKKQYGEIDSGVNYISNMQIDETYPLYVYDANNRLQSLYQFYFRKKQIKYYSPNNNNDAKIILANEKLTYLLRRGYSFVELDENEYVYLRLEGNKE